MQRNKKVVKMLLCCTIDDGLTIRSCACVCLPMPCPVKNLMTHTCNGAKQSRIHKERGAGHCNHTAINNVSFFSSTLHVPPVHCPSQDTVCCSQRVTHCDLLSVLTCAGSCTNQPRRPFEPHCSSLTASSRLLLLSHIHTAIQSSCRDSGVHCICRVACTQASCACVQVSLCVIGHDCSPVIMSHGYQSPFLSIMSETTIVYVTFFFLSLACCAVNLLVASQYSMTCSSSTPFSTKLVPSCASRPTSQPSSSMVVSMRSAVCV